jgi:hypothetical protein
MDLIEEIYVRYDDYLQNNNQPPTNLLISKREGIMLNVDMSGIEMQSDEGTEIEIIFY